MKFVLKFVAVLLVFGFSAWALQLWYQTFMVGRYYDSGTLFFTIIGAFVPAFVLGVAIYALWKIVRFKPRGETLGLLLLVIASASLAKCSRASANVQTLISDDCGVTWELIPPGRTIPARMLPCAYKVSVPDYPMQGETKFKTSFANRVLAEVEIGYEYSIIDAKVFIGEAKYLGKANTSVDDATNASSQYESAENAVIDKRIREVTTSTLINEDIVEFSQAEFEDRLLEAVNELLANKGVRLNFISFVPTPEEQTRLAIDMMTAMKVYESRGLGELGQKVAVARASATKIQVGGPPENK